MAVYAMEVGLTWEDLRHMKYTHAVNLIYAWEDAHDADVEETVQATSEDTRWLMSL